MSTSHRLRLLSLLVLAMPGFVAAQAEDEPADPANEPIEYAEEEYVEEDATEGDTADGDTADGDTADDDAIIAEVDAAEGGEHRRRRWLAPEPSFTLHGYLRTRGEWQDGFGLNRTADTGSARLLGYPFRYFQPIDRDIAVEGGCSSVGETGEAAESGCFRGSDRLRYANMRMRLAPTVSLSDDVRVHMVLDVFDNMVLGSTPDASAYGAISTTSGAGAPGVPLDFFSRTLNPATAGQNSLTNSIHVRRAWAEVGNRDLGELRFGRMAVHWGLGMLWNAGAGIDSDYSTDVDRVMVSRQLFGYTFGAAWDFMDEGAVVYPGNLSGLAYDGSNRDDVRQFSFFAARTLTPEEESDRLSRGEVVVVGGLYYQYRTQDFGFVPEFASTDLTSPTWGAPYGTYNPASGGVSVRGSLVRRNATSHTLDGWGRLRWKDLRVELEAALVVGELRNASPTGYSRDDLRLMQFGFALQGEYRLLDGKLGLYFDTGLATGDRDVDGLSIREDTVTQDSGDASDGRATHFTFHPNYRVDLILYRNILGSVGGSYYFRPGLSYELVRTDAGRLLGLRADMIYSRAVQPMQTYGGDAGLGIELDASIYYRSEDGPDLTDGFWAAFHYGILFPLDGLGYRAGEVTSAPSISKAQTLRVVLGVNF